MKRSLLAVPTAALLLAGLAGCGGGPSASGAEQCSLSIQGTSAIATFSGPGAGDSCDQIVTEAPEGLPPFQRVQRTAVVGAEQICHVEHDGKRLWVTATPHDPAGRTWCDELSKQVKMSDG